VREQLLAAETLLGDDMAFLTQANQVKDRLTDINAANVGPSWVNPPVLAFILPHLS